MAFQPVHWETKRLLDVFMKLETGETISFADAAKRCDMPVAAVKRRQVRAREMAQRDHVTIVSERGIGYTRLAQENVDVKSDGHIKRMRNQSRKASKVIRTGITDWDALPAEKKTKLFADTAVLATVDHVSRSESRRRIEGQVRVANDVINVGRTLELLK